MWNTWSFFSLCKLCDHPSVLRSSSTSSSQVSGKGSGTESLSLFHRQESERLYLAAVPNQLAMNGDSLPDVLLHLAFFLTHNPASVHAHTDGCFSFFIVLIHLFIFFLLWLSHVACGFHDQGSNPCALHWKHGVLTTEPPGKSPACFSGCFLELFTP